MFARSMHDVVLNAQTAVVLSTWPGLTTACVLALRVPILWTSGPGHATTGMVAIDLAARLPVQPANAPDRVKCLECGRGHKVAHSRRVALGQRGVVAKDAERVGHYGHALALAVVGEVITLVGGQAAGPFAAIQWGSPWASAC